MADQIVNPTPQQVLACPMVESYEAEAAGVTTVGGYLLALLRGLWADQGGFNGKRPFGTSGWSGHIVSALMRAGYVESSGRDDYCLTPGYDRTRAHELVAEAIMYLAGPAEPERRAAERATAAAIELSQGSRESLSACVAAIRAFTFDERQRDVVEAARAAACEVGSNAGPGQRWLLQAVNRPRWHWDSHAYGRWELPNGRTIDSEAWYARKNWPVHE